VSMRMLQIVLSVHDFENEAEAFDVTADAEF
jgi:hypothetical protein